VLISLVALVADCGARNDVARGVCERDTARSFRAGARNARRWRCSSVAPVHISASDIDLLFETAEVAAGQLPAASLAAVYAGGTACPDDTRSAVVATPATRGRRRAAAAAAVLALGIPRRHRPPLGGGGVGRRLRVGPPRVCPRPPPTCLRRRWSDGRGPHSPAVAEVGGRPPWGKRGGVGGGGRRVGLDTTDSHASRSRGTLCRSKGAARQGTCRPPPRKRRRRREDDATGAADALDPAGWHWRGAARRPRLPARPRRGRRCRRLHSFAGAPLAPRAGCYPLSRGPAAAPTIRATVGFALSVVGRVVCSVGLFYFSFLAMVLQHICCA